MITDGSFDAGRVRSALKGTLQPLEEHLATIEAAIERHEHELSELRELRRMVARMVELADPDRPRPSKPGPKRRDSGLVPGDAKAKAQRKGMLRDWLGRARMPEDGFTSRWVGEHAPNEAVGATSFDSRRQNAERYLAELADEGFLRLDHLGGHNNMSKFYKLASVEVK